MGRKKVPPNSKYQGLNLKEAMVFDFIKDFFTHKNYPPTVREICEGLKIPSTSTVYYYLESLENIGYIRKNGGKMRAIEIVEDFLEPIPQKELVMAPVLGEIAAGSPILADENIFDYFPIPLEVFTPQNDVFILKVKGYSMKDIGILDGDFVIVEQCSTANNGDIVAAIINEEATVKRYFREKDHIRLQPENKEMQPICVKEVHIAGKVIGLYRNMK